MFLGIDIGNTNISFGIFTKNSLQDSFYLKYDKNKSEEEYFKNLEKILKNKKIKECAISSVVDDVTYIINKCIKTICKIDPLIINSNSKLNLNIKSKTPQKIGIDRIANACAVKEIYKKYPAIVVDIGTATTFDIIDKEGNFIGGIILPGIKTQLKSLSDNTSKLPYIETKDINKISNTINTDTKKAILSGVIKGHAHAIEGLIEDCSKELETKPFLVATGGNAALISKYTKTNTFNKINPNLTLEGLFIINELNKN